MNPSIDFDVLIKTFDELPIGVGIFKINDPNDNRGIEYVYMNKVVLHEMRKTKEEVIGKKIIEVAPEAFEHEGGILVMDTYRKVAQDGKSVNLGLVEYSNHLVEGTYECTINPIKENYVYIMLRNVTELEEAKNKLEKRNKELLVKNKEIEEFVYIASHDLQEPLRTLKGFIDILTLEYRDQLDENASEYFKFINSSSDRMQLLIKDLLEYSKIGVLKKSETIDSNKLITEITNDLHDQITRTSAKIEATDLPKIIGNKTELRLLFQNLISNALKFRKNEIPPLIQIGYSSEKSSFFIKDNGIGIKPEDQEKIFKIFKRLHKKEKYDGSGIGLAHCLKIINNMNGSIWVESELNEGSTFFFEIKNNLA